LGSPLGYAAISRFADPLFFRPLRLAITIIAFIILGSVLEGLPAIVLFGPLLFPVAKAMGVHEVHYAMIVILAMGISLFAPPFGVGYYGACAIGRVSPDDALWRI
jgi:TRAP-type C4-dicarboxylate transport system permease large subunit